MSIKWLLHNLLTDSRHDIGRKFVCLEGSDFFSDIIAILCTDFHWERTRKNDCCDIYCLLIAESVSTVESLKNIVENYAYPRYLVIQIPHNIKSTNLFRACEDVGYRLFRLLHGTAFFYLHAVADGRPSGPRTINLPEIQEELGQSRRHISKLPPETQAEPSLFHGPDLLVPERFDIAIKCLYGRLWKFGLSKDWREYAYYVHIRKITGGNWEIREYDGSGKAGYDAFLESFHSLLGFLRPEEIPSLPVDRELTIFDGAHRVAAAIVNHRPVRGVRLDALSGSRAPSEFFVDLPEDVLDEAAIEYCRVKKGLAIALIFPTVANDTYATDHLLELGAIVYQKQIILSPRAGGLLLRQVYFGHEWFEDCHEDAGFTDKRKQCFPFPGPLRILLLDRVDPARIRPVKDTVRGHYKLGHHSIQITDSDEETLRVARLVFNRNSLEVLVDTAGVLPLFHQKLRVYAAWLEKYGLNAELFCLGGSAALSLLGLRECRDLDFLYAGDVAALPSCPTCISCHNKEQRHYPYAIADIIGDPNLHCWYMGIKFCAPRVVLRMKERRSEPKDRLDAALLRDCLPVAGKNSRLGGKHKAFLLYAAFRARLAGPARRLKAPLMPFVLSLRRWLKKVRRKR